MKRDPPQSVPAGAAQRFARLSPEKRALLAKKLKEKARGKQAAGIIPRGEVSGTFEPTFIQQQMWFVEQLYPGNPVYNRPGAVRISGDLDLPALQIALNAVIARHAILRARLVNRQGVLAVEIADKLSLQIPLIDLQATTENDRATQVTQLYHQAAQEPFDLEQGPLVRVRLIRISEQQHLLFLVFHHAVYDAWSMEVLLHELMAFYEASVTRSVVEPPALRIQYSDYAAWFREQVEAGAYTKQLDYWKRQLAGISPLELSTDYPRPAMQTARGACYRLEVPAAVLRPLRQLAKQENATLFMLLLTVFQVLLQRYTGQDDISVASPVAGRNELDTERLIGVFINTLLFRSRLSLQHTFREILADVRAMAMEAYSNQAFPFDRLVEALHPQRDLSRHPLFQVMFQLRTLCTTESATARLRMEEIKLDAGIALVDLVLDVVDAGDRLQCNFVYNTDLFEAARIERLGRHYLALLEAVVAAPDSRLSALPMLSAAERRQLLLEWNDTDRAYPRDRCIHDLFEQQAARTPGGIAVAHGAERLSYGELNARADRLAAYLRHRGVGRETLVGLCVERSVDMVVGMLGILKAGGAYVPLDPGYPPARLALMLADTQAPVVVTQAGLRSRLPEEAGECICLDTDRERIAREPLSGQPVTGSAHNLAYVIYTSGSTGRPKGVMVEHRSVANFISDSCERYALTPNDRVLQFSSLNFDGSVEEIFAALLSGATLVIRDDDMLDSPARFLQRCGELGITVSHLPTAYWHELVSQLKEALSGLPPSLRLVLIGGEKASGYNTRLWKQYADPRVQLVNSYGPTEATVVTTAINLTRDWPDDNDGRDPPIGRPMANTRVYILDACLQPVPIGVPGELYVGGDGLARGYLNREALTARRFVPDPFGDQPGSRLYATGDRVRYLANGHIEFLGRSDDQVKIRGFRIEPGEIESALTRHAAIQAAVVLAGEDGSGQRQLVAYLQCEPSQAPTVSALRGWLKESLPEYMVPAAFVTLASFPLNSNGKVDRKALPEPQRSRPEQDASYRVPDSGLEHQLAVIWSEVLGVDGIGVDDDFFDLGGHSLLATQVVSRIASRCQVEVSLQAFFRAPTIAALAGWIRETEKNRRAVVPAAPLRGSGLEEPACEFPASFAQQRLWFLDRLLPGNHLYNITIARRLRGRLDAAALEQSLEALVQRHDALRTVFREQDGQPVQVIVPRSEPALARRELSGGTNQTGVNAVQALIREEAEHPFDLATGPLFRATLLRLAADEHVLLLTVHHIVSDGWSTGIMFRELSELYAANTQGRAVHFEALPVRYADYAVWQRETLTGTALDGQLEYWKKQLADLPLTELPGDRLRPATQRHRGARAGLPVPVELTDALGRLARQEGVTLFMLMLAVFQLLLQRYTDQDDIVVGTPVAGRNRPEFEGLIGFFINTLVLRTDLGGDPSFRELLTRVKATTLAAYSHQEVPFEKLVEELRPARDLSRNPLFQIMFTLQNTPATPLSLPGLAVEPLRLDGSPAKFDISVQFVPGDSGLQGEIVYNTDLFEAARIERLGRHYLALLEAVVAAPDSRLSALPMLSPAERRRLLLEWNDTGRAYPRDRCIHELFEQQAARTPGAIAVEHGTEQLSYSELNAQADRLAAYLRRRGVGRETLVGLCVERSLDMVVGMLGILKAGGAYVPLDPTYPPARLALMLADTQAPVVVTQAGLRSRLPAEMGECICLDTERARIAAEPPPAAPVTVAAHNLAYVIYTSGSTGRPKGVCIPHRAVNRLVLNTDYVQLGPDDRMAQVSNISFDAATFEVWGTLLCGGALHIIDQDVILSPKTFAAALEARHITTLFLTTALFNQYARDVPDAFHSLKQVLFGGEQVDPRRVRAVLQAAPPQRLLHVYGPTENTTFTTWHEVKAVNGQAVTIPIGRAIANTRLYVLDDRRNPVSAGAPGELYIGGDGLARGYLNADDLTAGKFIDSPFAECPGERLYRTGDLVRYVDERTLEFIGRTDQQIKLRGFRVEPGEVEAVLHGVEGVQEAVVLLREDRPGDKRLVAYVVIDEACTSEPAVRGYLKTQLPAYLLPSAIVVMERLPLSPNGKVDRKVLPAPFQPAATAPVCAPKDFIEVELAKLWKQVLGVASVSVTDNFFDLGGHSLLGVQLFAEIEKKFGRRLPLAALFECPTIESMAALLRGGETLSSGGTVVAVRPEGRRPPFFCVHGRADLLARHLDPEQPLYWLHHAQDGANANYMSIEAVATAHLRDMREYQPRGPYYLGGYSFGGVVAFEMARQLQHEGEQVAMLALIDPTSPERRVALGDKLNRKRETLASLFGNSSLSIGQKLIQGGDLLGGTVRHNLKKLNRVVQGVRYRVDGARGRILTAEQKKRRLIDLFRKASRHYQYREYSGSTVLFVHGRTHHVAHMREQWGQFISGPLEVQVVDGVKGHLGFFREPAVLELSKRLNEYLQKRQTSVATEDQLPDRPVV